MSILAGDIKLVASAVMADVTEGGGAPTSNVIQDAVSNAIFPDISELDRAIGRALDPDTGGADSWTLEGDTITTSTPCTEAFYDQAQAMLADPALLYGAVSADYSARWSDLTPPTLSDCEAFIAGVIPDPVQEVLP
jgi:hypothetical protein